MKAVWGRDPGCGREFVGSRTRLGSWAIRSKRGRTTEYPVLDFCTGFWHNPGSSEVYPDDSFVIFRPATHPTGGYSRSVRFSREIFVNKILMWQSPIVPSPSLPAADPLREHPPVRSIPVQFATRVAPEEREPGLLHRCIFCTGNLGLSRHPEQRVAERTPAHADLPPDKSAIDELLHLHHHIVRTNEDRAGFSPAGKFMVPCQEYPVLLLRHEEKKRILFRISRRQTIRAHRVIPHEPEVPRQCTEHPVADERGFRFGIRRRNGDWTGFKNAPGFLVQSGTG